MDKWLKENEAFLRLLFRLAVVFLLLWLVSLADRLADVPWYLSEILDVVRRK